MNSAVANFYWSKLADHNQILDLGCGSGGLGKFRPEGVRIYGLDYNASYLNQAKAHYEFVSIWDLDRLSPLPFRDSTFDGVVIKDVLEHLQIPLGVVKEIRRILRPNGCVLASVICERYHRVWNDYTHVRGFTKYAAQKLFQDAGLHVENIWRMGPVPLTSRLNLIRYIPLMLRFPLFNILWTSSYEIKALKLP